MKKLTLLAFLMVGELCYVSAQIQFGVKAGYSLATMHTKTSDDVLTLSSKSDFHAGVLVNIPVISGLSVQPELVYSGQGTKYNDDDDKGKLNTALINIPVMVKYSYMGAFLETGPQIGFLASAKDKEDNGSQDVKNNLKSTEFAWGVGVGYLSKLGLGIDVRYNFALSDMVKSIDGGGYYGNFPTGSKNNVLQIGLLYMFGKQKH
jgi:hypothetical protein